MTNLVSVLKSRDITLLTKVRLVKAMVFPIVMYGCENWTIKKAECRRIDAFELWCWRRLLRIPQTARRSNQSILKEINPKYSLEGLMLKLKLQYFGHLMRRVDSLEKTLMLGKIGGRRRRGQQRTRWLDDITDSMDMNLSKLREVVNDCSPWDHNVSYMTEQLNSNSKSSVSCFLCRCVFLSLLRVTACSCGSSALCILSPNPYTSQSQVGSSILFPASVFYPHSWEVSLFSDTSLKIFCFYHVLKF